MLYFKSTGLNLFLINFYGLPEDIMADENEKVINLFTAGSKIYVGEQSILPS